MRVISESGQETADRSAEKPALRLALSAEFSPPIGGMTVQAELLEDKLASQGVSVRRVRTNATVHRLGRLRYVRGLIQWARFLVDCRHIPTSDVVHVFACSGLGFFLHTTTAVVLARIFGRPVFVHYHSGDADAFAKRYPRTVDGVIRAADALVVPSGFLEAVFADRGHAVRVIPNPLDVDAYHYAPRDKVVPVVVGCRNLFRKYDLATTLRAFALFAADRDDARLLLAGDGPEYGGLAELAAALHIADKVEFLGSLPNSEMPGLFARAGMLLNTSRFDNFPGSILEAMSSGLPVVSTEAGGIPWLVRDGESGKLAPVGNAEALADHLGFLADNPAAARRMAAAARASVEPLRWEQVGAQWHGLYDELRRAIDRPRRAAARTSRSGTAPTPTR